MAPLPHPTPSLVLGPNQDQDLPAWAKLSLERMQEMPQLINHPPASSWGTYAREQWPLLPSPGKAKGAPSPFP